MMIDRGVERAEEVFGRWKEEERGKNFLNALAPSLAGETDERRPGSAISDIRTILNWNIVSCLLLGLQLGKLLETLISGRGRHLRTAPCFLAQQSRRTATAQHA